MFLSFPKYFQEFSCVRPMPRTFCLNWSKDDYLTFTGTLHYSCVSKPSLKKAKCAFFSPEHQKKAPRQWIFIRFGDGDTEFVDYCLKEIDWEFGFTFTSLTELVLQIFDRILLSVVMKSWLKVTVCLGHTGREGERSLYCGLICNHQALLWI